MAKNSRVPSAVGSIPLIGGLIKQAENQAQWLRDIVEQNSRLLSQLPATMKSFNDSLERFNQTVTRLDSMVTRVESITNHLVGPMEELLGPMEEIAPRLERIVALLDIPTVWELPGLVDALRKEALPALRATSDTQKQVEMLQSTVEKVVGLTAELPGMGMMRRFAGGLAPHDVPPTDDRPAPKS